MKIFDMHIHAENTEPNPKAFFNAAEGAGDGNRGLPRLGF